MKVAKIGKNIGMTLIIPVAVYFFFFVLCNATGHAGFGVGSDVQSIMYTSIYSGLIALAMTMNLTSGRFDFSIGSTMILSIIVGGNIAKSLGFGGWGMLAITVLLGAAIGCVSGLVYVISGLPPMVVSLGMAMVYEALGFIFNNAEGVKLIGKTDMLIFSKAPGGIILIIIVLVVLVILWDYTKFGYNRSALATGQKISVDVGIKEKKNALICYIIAGALLGCAGCVFISKYGTMAPETGLSSSSYLITAFLPMFIGGTIAKYSYHVVAVFIGAITQAFITSGLSWMGCSLSVMNVISGIIVMIFLIYTSNAHVLVEQRMFKEKLEKARMAKQAK